MLTCGEGLYPYSLCNDAKVMKKILVFPEIEHFFNDLTNSSCSSDDYNFALNVYRSFNYKNLYEYTILYNHTDTLILAEIMMVYRKVIQDHFQMTHKRFSRDPWVIF